MVKGHPSYPDVVGKGSPYPDVVKGYPILMG